MKLSEFFQNAKILWGIIAALSVGLLYFINLVRSYQPEMNRLRLENIVQDSTITFQKIEIIRLEEKFKANKENIENAYDLFHDYDIRIKDLEK